MKFLNRFRQSQHSAALGLLFSLVLARQAIADPPQHPTPISVHPVDLQTPAGPVRGWVAVVDLLQPNLEIVVTGPFDPKKSPKPVGDGVNASLVAVDRWANDNNLTLAINANYFGWGKGGGHLIGWVVDDGTTVSSARSWKGRPDPSLIFLKDGAGWVARITGPDQPAIDQTAIRYAVSGVGGSASDDVPGTLLVQGGKNCGSTARVSGSSRLARTAAGVDASGHRLTLLAIDGRQPDWSVGITLPDLAALMIKLGVRDAINLDGGGSTSLVYRLHPGDPLKTNRPCDENSVGKPGVFRPVACQLGFKLLPP